VYVQESYESVIEAIYLRLRKIVVQAVTLLVQLYTAVRLVYSLEWIMEATIILAIMIRTDATEFTDMRIAGR